MVNYATDVNYRAHPYSDRHITLKAVDSHEVLALLQRVPDELKLTGKFVGEGINPAACPVGHILHAAGLSWPQIRALRGAKRIDLAAQVMGIPWGDVRAVVRRADDAGFESAVALLGFWLTWGTAESPLP